MKFDLDGARGTFGPTHILPIMRTERIHPPLLVVFMLLFAGGVRAQMQDIVVSGAGTSAVNGTYTYIGQYTSTTWGSSYSADYYQKGSIYIYRLSFQDFPGDPVTHWWRIGTSLGANSTSSIYYTVSSTQTHAAGLTFPHQSYLLGSSPGPSTSSAIVTNTWNGATWSQGSAPTTAQNVVLNSSASPGSFSARDLELEDGVDLEIGNGETVTISGNISGQAPLNSSAWLSNLALTGSTSNWVSGAGGTFSGVGIPANALHFDGTDDYASVSDNSSLDFTSGFTAETWVRVDALSGNHSSLISKFSGNNREFSLLLLASGVIEYSISFNGSTEQYFSGNTTLTTGTWYHVALTYDGSTMRAYLNGAADGTKSVTGTIYNGSSAVYLAARAESGITRFLNGAMDEVRLWNTARSQSDIQNNMNNELTGNETGLVAYYNFNQGTAGGSNTGLTQVTSGLNTSYNPNVISGSGTLVFDNSGATLSLSNVKLNMEGVVQVTTGTTLETNDSLTLTATSASSYGQIIGNGTVTGNVSSQAWLDVSTARYYQLGSPFTDATLEEFNEGQTMVAANNNLGTVWLWNAANAAWEAPSALADVAVNGKGYAIYAGTNASATFLMNGSGVSELNGTVASGDVSVALGYNNGQAASVGFAGGTSQADTEGWNFLSNPYPSQYDWSGQTLPTGMSNAFYVEKGGSFASYVNGVGTNGGTQYLAPFQGFWVQTTNATPGNFTFEQDQRVTAPSTSLMKAVQIDGVWLAVGDSVSSDEVYIGFDPQAGIAFDPQLDARKLLNGGDVPNLAIRLGGDVFSVCRVAPDDVASFPLLLDNAAHGRLLTFELTGDFLVSYDSVILEDMMLNVFHDLKGSSYSFTHDADYGPERFVLHFSASGMGGEELLPDTRWYTYGVEGGLNVDLGSLEDVTVELYDLGGRLLLRLDHQEGLCTLPMNGTGQLYLLKVISQTQSEIRKVVR